MLRVVVDFRFDEGGVGRYGRDLIASLSTSPGLALEVIREDHRFAGIRTRRFSPWARAAVAHRANDVNAALIHGLHFEAPRSRLPTVITVPDMRPFEYPETMSKAPRLLFTEIVRRSLARADRIIVTTPLTIDQVVGNGGNPDNVVVIPLGIGATWTPTSVSEQQEARSRWSDGLPYIAAVFHHHFRPHKNFARYLKAAEMLRHHSEIRFLCVGQGGRESLNLNFIGRLSDRDLRLFYGGAEMLVMPSLSEGFGYPILEALACGTPVVAGPRVGSLPFVSEAVLQVDVTQAKELAGGIETLLMDAKLRDELSAKGSRLVSPLTIEAMAASTLNIYRELTVGR